MKKKIRKIKLEYLNLDDYKDLKQTMLNSYRTMPDSYWEEDHISALIEKFPEGQVVLKINEKIAACALSIIIDPNKFDELHTYKDITGDYSFNTHDDINGDVLYGIDVFVEPEFRGLRLGRRLYDYRKDLCEKLNLKAIIFGGRIPNYHKYAEDLSPKQYIEKVKNKKIKDPVLNFQLANDFRPVKVLRDYLEGDSASSEFAVLMRWENIYYQKPSSKAAVLKKVVRIGIIQWQMRPYKDAKTLLAHAEYFLDALASYQCDFALFPELFSAPLMAEFNHLNEAEAIRKLAEFTPELVDAFARLAISYNINIITGSMPELVEKDLFNIGYFCKRSGEIERYEKIHVTPNEEKVWAMKGGNTIRTFNSDCGKIGILICYDVEFPELSRLMADDGMDILFVPFLTDTQNGYSRVRNCAQARAIENECYVAIGGSVGNLPNVNNMDIQYAQSMVFTPCDFQFPTNGVKSEATPNTEMILIADVDIDLLRELHSHGSVNNLKDRRKDLFELKHIRKSEPVIQK